METQKFMEEEIMNLFVEISSGAPIVAFLFPNYTT
jgi:hypothetical protein